MKFDYDRLIANGYEEAHPDTRLALKHNWTMRPGYDSPQEWVEAEAEKNGERYFWTPPSLISLAPPMSHDFFERRQTIVFRRWADGGEPIEVPFALGVWYTHKDTADRWKHERSYIASCRGKHAPKANVRILVALTRRDWHIPQVGVNVQFDAQDGRRVFMEHPWLAQLRKLAHTRLMPFMGDWSSVDFDVYDVEPLTASYNQKCRRCKRQVWQGDPMVKMVDLASDSDVPKIVKACTTCAPDLMRAWESFMEQSLTSRVERLRSHLRIPGGQ